MGMKKQRKVPRTELPEDRRSPEGVIPLKESMEIEPQQHMTLQQCIEAL
jgi:hypothetical protein